MINMSFKNIIFESTKEACKGSELSESCTNFKANQSIMYIGLLHTHSTFRYLVLIMLLLVIGKSLIGLVAKRPFQKIDNTLSLILLIVTHIQLLVGLILYFVSKKVQFGEGAMTDYRYFTVEHAFGMILAVVLITVGRVTSKKMTDDSAKFKRLSYLNILALIVIIGTLMLGHLKIIGTTAI
jgi:hypothetical protein